MLDTDAYLSIPDSHGFPVEVRAADLADHFVAFNGWGELCVWRHNPARPSAPVEVCGIAADIDPDDLGALASLLGVPEFEGLANVLGVRP